MTRWESAAGVQRGSAYDRRWAEMEQAGHNPHGEADFLSGFSPRSVLDAGCGTGRVSIELAARGLDVVGVDLDSAMLTTAKQKAPTNTWVLDDLLTVDLGRTFDVVALPGNVMIFLSPGTEEAVVANLARHVSVGGWMIAGFQVLADRLPLADYDDACRRAGLSLEVRHSTWDGDPYTGDDYAVSVHRRL
jgi:SAM-dependent methyltransferase